MKRWETEYASQVIEGFDPKPGTDRLAHCALGLTGEAGEVADLVKKSQYRTGTLVDRDEMKKELGDALWYLTAIADMFGWSLTDVALANVAKLEARRGAPYDRVKLLDSVYPESYAIPAVPLGAALPCSS